MNQAKKKQLRTIGHKLNPVVIVSDRGMSEGIEEELKRALRDHELIKVKLLTIQREGPQKDPHNNRLPEQAVINSLSV